MADTVLIVEDDPDIVELLSLYLTASDFAVVTAPDGQAGLEKIAQEQVDVALVDIMMPRMNGYDFIKEVRKTSGLPIVVVSARNQPADRIVGLEAGADGFICKPFDPMEVVAHIHAVLRRARSLNAFSTHEDEAATSVVRVGALAFNTEQLILTKDDKPIPLTAAELRIMTALMNAPGRVFGKDQLYECVNGGPCEGAESASSVMVHISNIRAKLEDDPLEPKFIRTVRGLGYRLDG